MEQVKLLSMTVLLTVLIWAGADSLVNEVVSIRVSFEVEPVADPDMLVELDPPAKTRWVEVQVSGPRKIIEDVKKRGAISARLRIDDRPAGTHELVLDRDLIRRALREQGPTFDRLTVLSAEPPAIRIVVDHMVTKELDITFGRLSLPYDEEPTSKTLFATLRIRASRFVELAGTERQKQLDISGEVERLLRNKPRGEPVTVTVALDSRVFGPNAILTPNRVEVDAVVKADRSEAKIPTVPIKLVVSFSNLPKRFHAVGRDGTSLTLVTQTIEVEGPAEEIVRLARGETRAYGFIQLKQADLEELEVYKAWIPEFYLPSGISLLHPPKPIEFKLVRPGTADAE
ncbi:MAG: hypothetical protein IIC02_06235 [Planctomycetes bacterium]|nr:hypothetical protein [Planctomycetota bacterium]